MSEGVIFLVGIMIFAITICGVVMAGGVALTKVVVEQDPHHQAEVLDSELTTDTARQEA